MLEDAIVRPAPAAEPPVRRAALLLSGGAPAPRHHRDAPSPSATARVAPLRRTMMLLLRRLTGGAGDLASDETPTGLTAAADAERPPTVIDACGHPRPPAMPEATGVYVVGDIHGELDSLQRVIQRITRGPGGQSG